MQTLFDHFKKINHTHESTKEPDLSDDQTLQTDLAFNTPFDEAEILKRASRLKNGKASGLDSIINEFIKHSPPIMISLLTKYFNIILESGVIPKDSTLGAIIPIYKNKGNRNDPDNYRGITLLSCIGKFFTLLINARLTDFIETNNLLGEEQAGFRAEYSTLDHIFTLHCLIDIYLKNKKRLYCAFVDYRKAFDMVDRCSLWQKVLAMGINGKVLKVIQNMYANAKSCVQLNGNFSEYFSCNIGVRQGENLSPLLFSIFLNDLAEYLSKSSTGIHLEYSIDNLSCYIKLYALLYADDTILISESPEDLQKMLDSLSDYCDKWKMHINANKTKIVIFSRGLLKKTHTFSMGSHPLEVTRDYTYLGIIFNYNGRFTKAISKQINQAKRGSFGIIAKARKLNLPIDIHLDLFDKCILPILLYGSEIWGFSNIQNIETFHIQYCKYILKINPRSVNNIALGELGRYKMEKYIKQRMLNFWVHVATSKNSKISYALYKKIRELHESGDMHSEWLTCIKSTLDNLNLNHLWDNDPSDLNPTHLKDLFKKNLDLYFSEAWRIELDKSTACDTYSQFKNKLAFEQYLTLLEPKYAIPLTKFRSNNHRMPLVLGRYSKFNKINRLDRICSICDSGDVGDEYHYLLRCPYFYHSRMLLLNPEHLQNADKKVTLKHVMNTTNIDELTKLSRFVSLILEKFRE